MMPIVQILDGKAGVIYRMVAEYCDYAIGSDGVVWSRKSGEYRPLKTFFSSSTGYARVNLCQDNIPRASDVHSLVLRSFVGERPRSYQACHENGNRRDARLDNLRYDTVAGNQADRVRHGTHSRGSRNCFAKLNESKVGDIRVSHHGGSSISTLARDYKVHEDTIRLVVTRKTWRHI